MGVNYSDTFNGAAANTNLADFPPTDEGPPWIVVGAANLFVVQTNGELRFNGIVGSGYAYRDSDQPGGFIEFTTASTLFGALHRPMAIRMVDDNNWVGISISGAGSSGFRLAKCVAGTVTDTIYQFQGVASTLYRVEDDGTDIRLYAGGSLIHTYNNSTDFVTEAKKGFVLKNTATTNGNIITSFSSGTIDAAGSIALTSITNNSSLQTVAGFVNKTFSGTYTGSPSSIELLLEDAASGLPVTGYDWQTLVAAPSGGSFSQNVSIPLGGDYIASVRFSDNTSIIDSNSDAQFGAGHNIAMPGQSNQENMGTDGTDITPNMLSKRYTSGWAVSTTTGNGINSLANPLIAATGGTIGVLLSAVGGTAMTAEAAGSSNYWSNPASTLYINMLAQITANGGNILLLDLKQGERDAIFGSTQSSYAVALTSFINQCRIDIVNSSSRPYLPIILGGLGRGTLGSHDAANFQAIRNAQEQVSAALPEVYIIDTIDLEILTSDGQNIHHTPAAYTILGARNAHVVKHILGLETYYRGAGITSVSQVDITHYDVAIEHNGGTDFTPTTGITGFTAKLAGTPVAVTAAVRQAASVIRLTTASAIDEISYQYGNAPDVSGAVFDNSAAALPLRFVDALSVSAPADLSTDATSTTSTAANLTMELAMTAAALAAVTTAGVVNQSMSLFGSAASITIGNGTATISTTFAGDAFNQAFADGLLNQATGLGGAAAAAADGSANLDPGAGFSGAAAGSASASASLNLTTTFSGAALIQALAEANLDSGSQSDLFGNAAVTADSASLMQLAMAMAGDAGSIAATSGALAGAVPVSGFAPVIVTGSAGLSNTQSLAGAAINVANTTGDVTVGFGGLSAATAIEALAGGSIQMSVSMSVDALIRSLAAATLSAGGASSVPDGLFITKNLTPTYYARSYSRAH